MRTRGTGIAALCIAAAVLSAARGGAEAPVGSADRLTAKEWADRMAASIAAIRGSGTADAAVEAYRAGCRIDEKNAELHEAYLRRLLRFGLLHAAYDPAEKLLALRPNNVLALATAAHKHATGGRLGDALVLTVRAAQIAPADPSIQNNLGQLVAWAELDEQGEELGEQTRQAAEALKAKLNAKRKGSFHDAYVRGKEISGAHRKIHTKYGKSVAAAEREIADAEGRYEEAAQAVRERVAEASPHAVEMEKLAAEMEALQAEARRTTGRKERRQIEKDYLLAERKLAALKARSEDQNAGLLKVKVARDDARESLMKKRAALAALREEMQQGVSKLKYQWRWDPPRLDGAPIRVVSGAPDSKLIPRPGAEAEAARDLKRAELYLNNQMYDKAREILTRIVKLYGATAAGREAKGILEKLPRETPPRQER